MKTADERIETLEKSVRLYRTLATVLVLLVLVSERYRIVGWIDKVESWFGAVASAEPQPIERDGASARR